MEDGSRISRQVQVDVVVPEAIILGKEEYHIEQVFFREISTIHLEVGEIRLFS